MGLLRESSYEPPYWLPGGHFQTIYPALFRTVPGVRYRRERVCTPDGDFLLLDWSIEEKGLRECRKAPLAILSHGFEGDSHRPYMTGMVRELKGIGFDCLAWNFRSCGGELNLTPRFYHSGATDDLDIVVGHALESGYERICLVGFSLGGNLTLKYLGEDRHLPEAIKKSVCFSVPMDLEACSLHLNRMENRVYQMRFLRSLRVKIRSKANVHPDQINAGLLSCVNSVYSFDDVFTGPLHGFNDARDYYSRCSAKRYIASIKLPTLIVNAGNDPMIPVRSLPLDILDELEHVDLSLTRQGGHCGYLAVGGNHYWSEDAAKHFLADLVGDC